MKKTTIIQLLILTVIVIFPVLAMAQTTPSTTPDPDTPIDGGLSLLVAAGVGYGAKKIKERRHKAVNA